VQCHRRRGPPSAYHERRRPPKRHVLHPKKVGTLPLAGDDSLKQTNEIGAAIPLLEPLSIEGKILTGDALLTQRKLARYVLARRADYVFTVKGNQPRLIADLALAFEQRGQPDFRERHGLAHGRLESRAIWTTTALNDYLDFPGVGQAFVIERSVLNKKTGRRSTELAYGLTSHSPGTAEPGRLLKFNRQHWTIENVCHYVLDWNWDEDRCRIRTGYGPENTTRLRRFAIGVIKALSRDSVAATLRRLQRSVRLVFDYLRMTRNAQGHPHAGQNLGVRTN
jgi:predicted transposase YbfD/YdcC